MPAALMAETITTKQYPSQANCSNNSGQDLE